MEENKQDVSPDYTPNEPAQKKKKLHGCWIALIIFLGVVIIAGVVIGIFVYRGIKTAKDEFEEKWAEGFEKHTAQTYSIDKDQSGDHLYIAQLVKLNAKNEGSLALLTQTSKINGQITGDLAVLGQTLTITEKGSVGGDLHFNGQVAVIKGDVGGTITGNAQSISIREDLVDQNELNSAGMTKIPILDKKQEADSVATETDTTKALEDTTSLENPDQTEDIETKDEQAQETKPNEESNKKKKKVIK